MAKNHLILLHGALGSKLQWERFLKPFSENFIIHDINFPGHGNSTAKLHNNHYSELTDSVRNYINDKKIDTFNVIGYSLGGYIGMDLLLQNIEGYRSLITIATKLDWNKAIAEAECAKLSMESLEPILDKLEIEHGGNYPEIIETTKAIISSIGNMPLQKTSFQANRIPVLMLTGSKDKMARKEDLLSFADNNASLRVEIMEDQPHAIERMDQETVERACLHYLKVAANIS